MKECYGRSHVATKGGKMMFNGEEEELLQALNSHPLLQALLQKHDRLVNTFASASCDGSLLLLLPLSTTAEAYAAAEPLHQQLLVETHLFKAAALPLHYINLRGQSIQRCDQHIYLELGFPSLARHAVLAEEDVYSSGVHLHCVLIEESLLICEGEDEAAAEGRRRRERGDGEGGSVREEGLSEQRRAAAAAVSVVSSFSSSSDVLRHRENPSSEAKEEEEKQRRGGRDGSTLLLPSLGEREEEDTREEAAAALLKKKEELREKRTLMHEDIMRGDETAAAAARVLLLQQQRRRSLLLYTSWEQQQQQRDLQCREQHIQEMLAAERDIQETVAFWREGETARVSLPPSIRRDLYFSIQTFRDAYILALGCEEQIVSRLHELSSACSRQVSFLLQQQRQQQQQQRQQQQQQSGLSSGAAAGSSTTAAAAGAGGGGGAAAAAAALAAAAAVARPAAAVAAVKQLARRGAAAACRAGSSTSSSTADSESAALSPAKISPFIERVVYVQLHEMMWGFAVDALQRRQEKLQRRLGLLKKHLQYVKENLQLQPLLRDVPLEGPAVLLDQMSSLKLPEHKVSCLRCTVEAIQEACKIHVLSKQVPCQQQQDAAAAGGTAVSSSGTPFTAHASEPIEVSADDLVTLLLITVIVSGGRLILANYWFASLSLLKQCKTAQFAEGSFYLTSLYSALAIALQLRPPSRQFF